MQSIIDEHGKPWWGGKEICEILERNNVTEALRYLDDDEMNKIRNLAVISRRGKGDRWHMDGSNVPIGAIQRILGHENRKTTEIYLHSIGDLARDAMLVFERALEKSHTESHTGIDPMKKGLTE